MKIKRIMVRAAAALLCVAAIMTAATPDAAAKGHEKLFGLRGGYITKNQSGAAGVYFTYGLNRWLRISPSMDYVFKKHGMDAYAVNADVHFKFNLGEQSSWSAYPIAGLGYWSWNRSVHSAAATSADQNDDDVSTRSHSFCINMGGGLQWLATPTLAFTLEARYSLMRHTPLALISLAIGYKF